MKTCEICGSTAKNVAGVDEAEPIDQWSETNGSTPSRATAPMATSETRNFWQGHRFLNFLLASMVQIKEEDSRRTNIKSNVRLAQYFLFIHI
uniref:Uncharacterized protein n=1 Tax=Lactuca sativa TaxID=4236 RepID=A0A9R1UTM8_LACSA|nr:hypothetical protein LSAT_V11C800394680 [Lactuca sativa]